MLVDPALHAQVHVDGVITMAHAKHIVQQLADHPEASGLASPGPVLQGMLVDPALHAQVHVDGVITMAHAN